ncbi:ABC transporter permease [Cryptosporangium sp. NPDC048952]|uniref:ABC transporter permease n=1 Tax=Cryptosporangium sp. NPDC048952 TaxID=3363961 RepID=UPI003718E42C
MNLKALRGLLPVAVVLILWQLVGDKNSVNAPPPSVWWEALRQIDESGELWPAIGKTLRLGAIGLLAALAIGVAVGTAIGASRRLTAACGPLLEFARATPAAAIVPAALLLFSADMPTQAGLVTFGTVWPILLNTAAARAAVPPLRLEVAACLRMSRWARLRKVVLPSLLPEIMTGLRVAVPICLIVALLVDFLVATGGIGYLLVQYQQTFQISAAYALLTVIGVVGILLNVGIGAAERLILRRWPG